MGAPVPSDPANSLRPSAKVILERAAGHDAIAALRRRGRLPGALGFALPDFLARQRRPAGVARRTLQRNLVLLRPNPLQVGVSPCRFLRCCGGHHRDGAEQGQSRFAHAQ
ncbi:MAG TPA: hypothetical protein VN654_01425 [Vicinamibacterales bacterium]|nr:hypothetical protein [Vicinamibacterales bacterium]